MFTFTNSLMYHSNGPFINTLKLFFQSLALIQDSREAVGPKKRLINIFSETAATAALNCVRDKGVLGLHLVQSTCESFLIPGSDIFGCENVLE